MSGTITYQIPQAGQARSTEEPKVSTALTTILASINGGLDTNNLAPTAGVTDAQLASPNNSVRRLLLTSTGAVVGAIAFGAGTDYILVPGSTGVSGSSIFAGGSGPPPFWHPDSGLSSQPADFSVSGKSRKARVRATVMVNTVTPLINAVVGLYQVTGMAGGPGSLTITFGAAVAGSAAAVINPLASTAYGIESNEFALPTAAGNPYFLGVSLNGGSGTAAANSVTFISAQLYGYNA